MINGFLKKIGLLITISAGSLMLNSCDSAKQDMAMDKTPITVHIPSKISNDVLSITLPKCALEFIDETIHNNELTSTSATITYGVYAYSGNVNNYFDCVIKNPSGTKERNRLRPIYPLANGQPINSGYDYLTKSLKALGKIGKEFTKISENNNQNSNRSTQQESVTNISSNKDVKTSNIADSQNDYPTPTFYL